MKFKFIAFNIKLSFKSKFIKNKYSLLICMAERLTYRMPEKHKKENKTLQQTIFVWEITVLSRSFRPNYWI